jgi:hypothetical protein
MTGRSKFEAMTFRFRSPPQFGQCSSLIDTRRRAQLVRSPAERRSSRRSRPVPRTDVVVTFRVDGEALNWACDRLLAGASNRRLLLVISDVSPMDSATALATDPHHHLGQVVAWCVAESGIEILGLGVGLDQSPFYQGSIAIDLKATACCRRRLPRSCDWWVGSGEAISRSRGSDHATRSTRAMK